MVSPPLVIRWAESESPQYQWCIRGLRVDGSYYGEVRSTFAARRESDGAAGVGRSIDGKITAAEMERIVARAASIRSDSFPETDRPVVGVLADGPVNCPAVLYRCANPPDDSPAANALLDIIAILRPYMSVHYPALT